MKRIKAFHPVLLAVYPVLFLYATNSSLLPLVDIWRPLGCLLAATLILWLVAHLILRDVHRSAVLTSLTLVALMSFGHVHPELADEFKNAKLAGWWIPWIAVIGVLVWKFPKGLNRLLNYASVVLIAFVLFNLGKRAFRSPVVVTASTSSEAGKTLNLAEAPDIYYIVCDGYGSVESLKSTFDFDNQAFVDELKKRGFVLPAGSHTNYCQTELSLASSLNLEYIQSLFKKGYPSSTDRIPLDDLVIDSRLKQDLAKHGYQFQAVMTGFPGFAFGNLNIEKNVRQGLTLTETSLLHLSALPDAIMDVGRGYLMRGRLLKNAMATLKRQGVRTSAPRFTFAHILMPHPPFVLTADGDPVFQKGIAWGFYDGSHYMALGGTFERYRQGYTGQAQYLNKMLLAFIDQVLKDSKVRPIIVIQGDHGSKSKLDQDSLEHTDLQECMPILNAYLVPDEMKKDLYGGITPVNSWRIILRHLLGENLPNLPDRSYYAPWSNPYRFTDVTAQIR